MIGFPRAKTGVKYFSVAKKKGISNMNYHIIRLESEGKFDAINHMMKVNPMAYSYVTAESYELGWAASVEVIDLYALQWRTEIADAMTTRFGTATLLVTKLPNNLAK
jgi:hypothetical protein